MKQLKHLLTVAFASVLALLIAVPAFAAGDTSITVSELEAGDQVNYYQVIAWDGDAGKWVLTDDFKGLIGGTLGATEDDVIFAIAGDTETAGTISQDEANVIAGLAATAKNLGPDTVDATKTWTKNDPDAGLYMVIVAAKTPNIVYNPIFVGADYSSENGTNSIGATAKYSDTAVAKKTTTSVKKTADDANQQLAQAIDSKVGETVNYEFETTLPVFLASYKNPVFNITDAVTKGIELDPDTIEVTLTPAYTGDDTIYSITSSATGFTIEFTPDFLKSNTVPRTVTVKYDGEVTSDAEFNLNYDNNTVTVDYSNGPNNEKGALKDITNHYTFSIGAKAFGTENEKERTYELIKVGVIGEGDEREYVVDKVLVSELEGAPEVGALEGAEFTLYAADQTTEIAKYTTDGTGILNFTGLDAGTYYIKETKVPAGYVGDQDFHKVEIVANYSQPKTMPATVEGGIPIASYEYVVLDSYEIKIDGETTSTYQVIYDDHPEIKGTEIDNTPGVQLPSTGGIGTTIFYVVGGAMVLCGIVMFITKRRIAQIEE